MCINCIYLKVDLNNRKYAYRATQYTRVVLDSKCCLNKMLH